MKYADPNNRFIDEVINHNEYDFLNYYETVIDVGANIGSFSFWIYDHAERIYAIEPVKENIDSILETIRQNNLKKIIVKQMAIGDRSSPRGMVRRGKPEDGGWRLDESGDYPVDCRTLEDFLNSVEIKFADLVKLDVEGEELKILQAKRFPKDRIGTIIGEFHSNVDRNELKETLEWLGFRYSEIANNHFIARR